MECLSIKNVWAEFEFRILRAPLRRRLYNVRKDRVWAENFELMLGSLHEKHAVQRRIRVRT